MLKMKTTFRVLQSDINKAIKLGEEARRTLDVGYNLCHKCVVSIAAMRMFPEADFVDTSGGSTRVYNEQQQKIAQIEYPKGKVDTLTNSCRFEWTNAKPCNCVATVTIF